MKIKNLTLEHWFLFAMSIAIYITFGIIDISSVLFKNFAFGITICALIYTFFKKKEENIASIVGFSTVFYFIAVAFSTLYANAGKFAVNEFVKYLIAFSAFLLVCFAGKVATRAVLWVVTSLVALTSLLTIEGASLGLIWPKLEVLFYGVDTHELAGYWSNRVSSIFGNSNVFATMIAVALFFSLYLFITTTNKKSRICQGFYLAVLANAFFLTFSRGGTFCFAIAVLGYLAFYKGDEFFRIFSLISSTALFSFLAVMMTVSTYVLATHSGSVLPLVGVFASFVLILLSDKFIGVNLDVKLKKVRKILPVLVIVTAILGVIVAVLAMTVSTSVELEPNSSISRILYLSEENYDIEFDILSENANVRVKIETRTMEQAMERVATSILDEREISNDFTHRVTIAENVVETIVTIYNNGDTDVTISNAFLKGENQSAKIHLKYVFMPENIALRMQGLPTTGSLILRIQYHIDAWKLFELSPILGHGLGGFENSMQMVQNYQYETKYVHNHFAQMLSDNGIIGFIAYCALIITCIITLFKIRKNNDVAVVLFASMIMIIFHGATEISMVSAFFMPIAFVVFGLIVSNSEKKASNEINGYLTGTTIATVALILVLLAGNIHATKIINGSTVTFDDLEFAAKIDIYGKNDAKLSYVLGAKNYDDSKLDMIAEQYLVDLEQQKSNVISRYLAGYYLELGNLEKSFEQANIYVERSIFDEDSWSQLFDVYDSYLFEITNITSTAQNIDLYFDGIDLLYQKFAQADEKSIGTMNLTEPAMLFIDKIYYLNENNQLTEFFEMFYDATIE